MYIIPAIDLVKGKCVRLIQGDYNRQMTYEQDPVKQAGRFIEQDAQWLHIVDLDGAKLGRPVNTETISAIAALGKLKIEVGGGIREQEHIKQLLDLGIQRVIIGTKAIEDFEWFGEMANKFSGKIVLGLDARGSKVATHGWTQDTPQNLLEFASQAAQLPLTTIIYTDISKDGMMAGPNIERTKNLAEKLPIPVIASGGVTQLSDVEKLKNLPIEAIIIGRALYEGTINLTDAINAVN